MFKNILKYCSFLTVFGFLLLMPRFALAQTATGNTYYVAPAGSDSSTGTVSAPLKTISAGIAKLVAGDTLYVRSGTYPSFVVSKSGKAGSQLTISAYPGEMPVISGGEGIRLKSASYVTIHGFDVTASTGSWNGAIMASSGNNNLIEYNKIHDISTLDVSGILITDGSNNKILNNEVYNTGYEGIRITSTTAQSGNEIGFNKTYNNTIAMADGDGMGLNGPLLTGNYIHDNVVYGNADDGIDTWDSPNNRIIGNLVYSNGVGTGDGNGIKSGGSTTGGNNLVVRNIVYGNKVDGFASNGSGSKFYNNTSSGNGGDGFNDGWRNAGCKNCKSEFINNIGVNNGRYNAYFSSDTLLSHHNIWYSPASIKVNKGTTYTTLAKLFAATTFDDPSKSKSLDPLFVNPSAGQFGLQSNSPAINIGDPTNPGQVSLVGIPDLGAIEYAGASTPATPTPVPSVAASALPSSTPTPTPGPKPGDANNNNVVDESDFTIWKTNFLTKPSSLGFAFGDFDNNGKVDGIDYIIWLNNYGK